MLIQCTKALLDKLEIPVLELKERGGYGTFPESLKAWHASLITIERRKAIVLMNNQTRFLVVLYGPTKSVFKKIKQHIEAAISLTLRMEGMSQAIIEKYLDDAGEIEFSKTENRSLVAQLNKAVEDVYINYEFLDESTLHQPYLSSVANRNVHRGPNNDYLAPLENMYDSLRHYLTNEESQAKDLFDVELYQLKIQIEIEGVEIWRRILIPSACSFYHLHNVIQGVFDWQNYHLHFFEAEKPQEKQLVILTDNDLETLDMLNPEFNVYTLEKFTPLKNIFPVYKKVRYVYDFGDNWEHTITLEKVVRSKSGFEVVLLDRKGHRPPEDVGGEWGYHQYLSISKDPENPDHENMKEWALSQTERDISIEEINRQLKYNYNFYYYYRHTNPSID
ncbi:MAG: plasmid pRiA4b ORF-3 family protein [Firmicutes bacterium]|nr:plasmid pRiA4b ORF-3 family protein [Bacillota bacterium]MDD4264136.1 plasmid pRiA4b ORF-3 family protein [Bacillota bacterium]MDD4694545.1 plasmid pRiA4b ORF-3 family protein [Bacillota bacterium]